MKLLLASTFIAILFSFQVSAQTEGSAFTLTGMGVSTPFARDYQALGINPGNLDIKSKYEKKVTLGLAEGAVSFYSKVLTKPELRQNLFREDIKDFSQAEQKEYALQFANSDNASDVDFTLLGLSIQTENLGTFAVNVRERMDFYSKMGSDVSQLIWLGYTAPYFDSLIVNTGNGGLDTIPNTDSLDQQTINNIVQGYTLLANAKSLSELLQGTKFGFSAYTEIALGWGKKVFETENLQFHAGLTPKLLIGHGMLDISASNGQATAFSSLSKVFGIDYGKYAANNPSALDSTAGKLQPVGRGMGFDIGATVIYKEKFYFSAAVTDIGKITWTGNLYKLNDVNLTNFDNSGLESVSFVDQVQQLNGSDGILNWQGEQKRVTKLPTAARFGFGYDKGGALKLGIDIIAPVADDLINMQKAVIAVGGEYAPTPWIHLQAGFTQGGNYGVKIPVGIYFTLGQGTYEAGVASRDFVTFFRDNSPTISMAFGFLRFRF